MNLAVIFGHLACKKQKQKQKRTSSKLSQNVQIDLCTRKKYTACPHRCRWRSPLFFFWSLAMAYASAGGLPYVAACSIWQPAHTGLAKRQYTYDTPMHMHWPGWHPVENCLTRGCGKPSKSFHLRDTAVPRAVDVFLDYVVWW
jgi:hypothetical protein